MSDESVERQRRIDDYLRSFEQLDPETKRKHYSIVLLELSRFIRTLASTAQKRLQ